MVKTIRDLVDEHPELHDFDYKWSDSENFRYLIDVLNDLGYTFKHDQDYEESTEYNDIKAYLNVEIVEL